MRKVISPLLQNRKRKTRKSFSFRVREDAALHFIFFHKRKIILHICNDKTPFRLSNRLHKIVCVHKRAVYVDVLRDFLDARDAHVFAEH